jgi:hypothetical protein
MSIPLCVIKILLLKRTFKLSGQDCISPKFWDNSIFMCDKVLLLHVCLTIMNIHTAYVDPSSSLSLLSRFTVMNNYCIIIRYLYSCALFDSPQNHRKASQHSLLSKVFVVTIACYECDLYLIEHRHQTPSSG